MKKQRESHNDLFVSCSQGLEPLLAQELEELGFKHISQSYRGVYVEDASLEAVYRINYCSRIAGRVLLPLKRFRCFDRESLYHGASAINWLKYIPKGKTIAVDANVDHPNLRNSLFAAQIVKDAICDQFRAKYDSRPTVDTRNPDVQLNLFIHRELAVISFDTSGAPLFKRGYRQDSMEAPLRESLAAAMLKLALYKGDEIVYDPCCGSGTLLIEAALMATKTPPGFLRQKWGFMYLPEFSQEAWLKVKSDADKDRQPLTKGLFYGTDLNKNAVHVSKVNLRAAGFHQAIEVSQYDFREYTPPVPPSFVITNPPHGNRLGEIDFLRPLYRSLGDFMKRNTAKPARGFVFTGNLDLAKEVGLAPTQRHVIDNSGIESRLLAFDLY